MKYIFYLLLLLLFTLITCSKPENERNKENCDFAICEEGRNVIDTVIDVHGLLMKRNDLYYIEVTGNSPKPDTLFISCLSSQIVLPSTGTYVKFGGKIKDPCSKEISSSTDSLLLNEIEIINPVVQEICETKILQEGFDVSKNDEKLTIHHLTINDDCLYILISYSGNCSQIPELTLHNSGDILFGDVHIVVSLQGSINDDCNQENYALLMYDLEPLWDVLVNHTSEEVILYFLSQGMLKIGYRKLD